MAKITTWKKLIGSELAKHGESFADIVSITLSEDELLKEFDSGYGSVAGKAFTAWTHNRVYFPTAYDGAEWVRSVSRSPDGWPTPHIGGDDDV